MCTNLQNVYIYLNIGTFIIRSAYVGVLSRYLFIFYAYLLIFFTYYIQNKNNNERKKIL